MIAQKESNNGNSLPNDLNNTIIPIATILAGLEEGPLEQVYAHCDIEGIPIGLPEQQQLHVQLQHVQQPQEQQHIVVWQETNSYYNYNYNNSNTNRPQLIVDVDPNNSSCFAAFDDYASSSNQTVNQEIAMNDLANTSDASTVEDGSNNNEPDLLATDDAYSYLQGLDSSNLMKFSQQSEINELIRKEHLDIKPNLDVLPTFDQHDIGGYKFHLNLRTQSKGKVHWIHSESLNKVYIRMNETFSFDAVYTPKMPLQQLRLRILMCFVKEISEPVRRCQNHISIDTEPHPKKRNSLLRCDNPNAEYCGFEDGKSINDRYSVMVPLAMGGGVVAQEDHSVKQSIALKFSCQNSCIGRKETSLIFVLEGMNGEILSQRVLDVKICSCPKRDRQIDERNTTKRKVDEDLCPRDKKFRKTETASVPQAIKEEFVSTEEESDTESHTEGIERLGNGSFRLILESRDEALRAIDAVLNRIARKMVSDSTPRLKKRYRKLKRLYDKAAKI